MDEKDKKIKELELEVKCLHAQTDQDLVMIKQLMAALEDISNIEMTARVKVLSGRDNKSRNNKGDRP
jgi:hypothetical protein